MIEIINQQHKYWLNPKRFKDLLKKLVEYYKLKDPEVVLVFVDTKTIKQLNLKFLKKNAPTDVLSFPLGEKSVNGKYYLGDIVISVPQAFKQCFSQEHGLEKELELLTIHGFLHLIGFDHSAGIEEEEDKIRNLK
ncbi:MAG: rRNA maturation RNase YbeY [Candidatus Aminicenantes bacterium]|nr:rRNA maturation RNase YbeY [Candidatus Aminicenantes bacterium]MBL7083005.1 rRNA maturation RNase YbeY [Candidatus Aminicenantes bacterium]